MDNRTTYESPRGILCIMGSGETSPTMVKVHRKLLAEVKTGSRHIRSVLDTPYGFQENADELSKKSLEYFQVSLNKSFEVASLRTSSSNLTKDAFLERLGRSSYVFAGPGSPTYALKIWKSLDLDSVLFHKLTQRHCVTFSSAAALTLGRFTLPVYEIYKAGEDLRWEDGLNLLERVFNQSIAVIPHYNNQEGGTHDTRYCYMGERRLEILEESLPEDAFILGIDEHTCIIFDLEKNTTDISGIGAVTLRRMGVSHQLPSGTTLELTDFLAIAAKLTRQTSSPSSVQDYKSIVEPQPISQQFAYDPLKFEIDRLGKEFDHAFAAKKFPEMSRSIVELDNLLAEWEMDSLDSDTKNLGRRTIRSMVIQLGELATKSHVDKTALVAPFVEAMIDLRNVARSNREFQKADQLRSYLKDAGVEISDTQEGTSWSYKPAIVSSTDN